MTKTGHGRNDCSGLTFLPNTMLSKTMATFYPPVDPVVREALEIAMDERTGQVYPFSETGRVCALIILKEWEAGNRHRIWLANTAITAIEARTPAAQSIPITVTGSIRGH
jgi:hypothetical protein